MRFGGGKLNVIEIYVLIHQDGVLHLGLNVGTVQRLFRIPV